MINIRWSVSSRVLSPVHTYIIYLHFHCGNPWLCLNCWPIRTLWSIGNGWISKSNRSNREQVSAIEFSVMILKHRRLVDDEEEGVSEAVRWWSWKSITKIVWTRRQTSTTIATICTTCIPRSNTSDVWLDWPSASMNERTAQQVVIESIQKQFHTALPK